MTDFLHRLSETTVNDRVTFQKQNGIIGRSVEMCEIVDTVLQVAPTDITVLITGESGTGKEVIANAIHNASRRAAKKFIAVNCGAIPEGILESELFGHEKGSFTGAIETRKGYFEIADGGTIFLDEIGDTPISTQVKLLRVLENGEFMRVGSSEQRTVNVRVIAATNKELEQEVQTKHFRQDLYFRLRSVNIRIPPLRNRRADIPLFIESFLSEEQKRDPSNHVMFTDQAMATMMRHSWQGNVRELKNTLESIFVLEHGRVVDEVVLAKYLHSGATVEDNRSLPVWLGKSSDQAERELIFRALFEIRSELVDLRELIVRLQPRETLSLPIPEVDTNTNLVSLDDFSLLEMEKRLIRHTLTRFGGNRRVAADTLGISERTLYRKIKDYGL